MKSVVLTGLIHIPLTAIVSPSTRSGHLPPHSVVCTSIGVAMASHAAPTWTHFQEWASSMATDGNWKKHGCTGVQFVCIALDSIGLANLHIQLKSMPHIYHTEIVSRGSLEYGSGRKLKRNGCTGVQFVCIALESIGLASLHIQLLNRCPSWKCFGLLQQ